MLENIKNIKNKINFKIKGIIHIGAGSGSEMQQYLKNNIKNLLLIEADTKQFTKILLRRVYYDPFFRKNIKIKNIAISNKNKILKFNMMNIKDCNSLLDLKKHSFYYPHIKKISSKKVRSSTLDSLFKKNYDINDYNFINIDIQGAELMAFQGAKKILKYIDGIYSEINFEELYKNCVQHKELDKFLSEFNFKRVYTNRSLHKSWGDALYIKNKTIK